MNITINRKRIFHGIQIFIGLTILGFSTTFYLTGSRETWLALQKFHPGFLLLAGLLILVDFLSGALRIHIFARSIQPKGMFVAAFKANLANIFMAAATPFQTGGGLAQLYVLSRNGISYAAGLTISVLNFVATLSMLFIAATFILAIWPNNYFNNGPMLVILDLSRIFFYLTMAFFIVFLFWPQWIGKLAQVILTGLANGFGKYREKFIRLAEKITTFIDNYKEQLQFYRKTEKWTLVWNFILTTILYFNKCLVAYVIFRGLGLHPDFWHVVMLQMLIVFFLYFAPTPGASFIAETGTSAVMSFIAPNHLLSLFAVLWRFFTTYLGVMLGSAVLIKEIQRSKD